jgi:hypothetical protein
MGSLPSLRATGHKVWSRIRSGDRELRELLGRETAASAHDAKMQALRQAVERVATVRSPAERATQLARVLDAVSAVAAAHGLNEADLDALRVGRPLRARVAAGIKRQVKRRAANAAAHVWTAGTSLALPEQRVGLSAAGLAAELLKRTLLSSAGLPVMQPAPAVAPTSTVGGLAGRGRAAFVLRVGRVRKSPDGRARRPQLIAASLLHLPRLQRQVVALRRGADVAISRVKLVRLPASPLAVQHVAAAGILLRSSRSGLQLTYEVATAGAQLFLRRYVMPRVLRYLSAGLSNGVATVRVLPPAR